MVRLTQGGVDTVLDDLQKPQGILVRDNMLYVVDTGAKELIQFDMVSNSRQVIATDLPVGAPPGVVPKFLDAIGVLSGPMGPFADITGGKNGVLYVSADAEGSVLEITPNQH